MTGGGRRFPARLKRWLSPFRVGHAFGIPLRVHPATLLVWGLLAHAGLGAEGAVLFGSVLLHEVGHAWVAGMRGLRVYEVDLLPFGGAARMQAGVWSPADECVVAIAGPCVNGALAALALAGEASFGGVGAEAAPAQLTEFLRWSSNANVLLATFNLLPILPLDGGRVLRAALVGLRGKGVYETTQRLSQLSRALAVLLGLVGLLGVWRGALNVSWVVAALFLHRAASEEESSAAVGLLRQAARPARGIRGSGVRSVRAFAVSPDTAVGDVLRLFQRGSTVVLVVDRDGLVLGTLLEGDVWDGATRLGLSTPIVRIL